MISVLIGACAESEPDISRYALAYARSLARLTPFVLADLIRDGAIVGAPGRGLEEVAEEAGCGSFVHADGVESLRRALHAARCARILFLRAGYAPDDGLIEEMLDLRGSPPRAHILLADARGGWRRAIGASMIVGVLAQRDDFERRCARARAVGDFARGLKAISFRARARRLG